MAERIETPPTLQGDEKKQLQQVWSYLYQLAESINNNLQGIGSNELTDSERVILKDIIGAGEEQGLSEMETLKSLIIKTADFVQTSLTEYRLNLLGETVASGQFGRYVRHTGLDVAVTPTGITQNYSFEEVVQGLKEYSINAKNYIKTGLLRTVSNIPVYGVAIGKDVVTFSQDGTETYNDGNKVAELTADELSFWQNGVKVAGYTGSRISFYYGGTEALYIQNGKIYCAADLEISAGKTLKIVSGGTLDVDTNNFKINSESKEMICGNWTFNNKGCEFSSQYYIPFQMTSEISRDGDKGGLYWFSEEDPNRNLTVSSLKLMPTLIQNGVYYHPEIVINAFRYQIGSQTPKTVIALNALNTDEFRAFENFPATRLSAYIINHIKELISEGNEPIKICLKQDYSSSSSVLHVINLEYDNANNIYSISKPSGVTSFLFNIHCDNLYYGQLIQNSSREIKHDIQDLPEMGERLDRLRPVTFVYDNDENEQQRMGLIYEETVDVMPEICTGNEAHKAINYVELIPALLKEIQGLRARVKALEEREGGN